MQRSIIAIEVYYVTDRAFCAWLWPLRQALTHGFSILGKVLTEQGMGVYLHKLALGESLSETSTELERDTESSCQVDPRLKWSGSWRAGRYEADVRKRIL